MERNNMTYVSREAYNRKASQVTQLHKELKEADARIARLISHIEVIEEELDYAAEVDIMNTFPPHLPIHSRELAHNLKPNDLLPAWSDIKPVDPTEAAGDPA